MVVCIYDNLWWPFGAHLLNVKWRMIDCIQKNNKFYYLNNNSKVFPNNKITDFFEDWNDDISNEKDITYPKCNDAYVFMRNRFCPKSYKSIYDFHSAILKKIYRPNIMVQQWLNENIFLNKIKDMDYIAVHIRWTDKVAGNCKETNFIGLHEYLDRCIITRNKYNINNVVICSDTQEGIDKLKELNEDSKYKFKIFYNDTEDRCPNKPELSIVQNINNVSNERQKIEYLYAFSNINTLINSHTVIGNYDSCFCLIAIQIRNKIDKDMNVNKGVPRYGIDRFRPKGQKAIM